MELKEKKPRKNRKKVGEMATELMQKAPETRDPIELQREMMKEYCDEVIKCALDGQKYYKGDFYVVVITKKEKLMPNVLRSYYLHRATCPTPDWDQAVYRYNHILESFEQLWVIPEKETSEMLYFNALEVAPEEHQLRDYCIDFYSGNLLKKAKMLNGERADSPLLEI